MGGYIKDFSKYSLKRSTRTLFYDYRSLKVKLTRKHDSPCLSFEIENNSIASSIVNSVNSTSISGSNVRYCTHDIPVNLIARKHWSDFKEPLVQKFDVSIYLPDLKRLKHIAERYKNLDNTVVLRANRNGELRFTLDSQRVTVGTYFKNLETPPFIDDKESKLILIYNRIVHEII